MIFARSLAISVCRLLCLCVLSLPDRQIEAGEQGRPHQSPISYSHQVKPLLMRNCAGCHGPDAWWSTPYQQGLDVTTYAGLMKGGIRGADVVPGSPRTSRLQQYVETGVMPFTGEKLKSSDLQLLSAWIKEGAKEDHEALPSVHVILENVPLKKQKSQNDDWYPYEDIVCHIPVESYATIIVSDPATGTVLSKRGGAVLKNGGGLGTGASTNGWLNWSLNQDRDNHAPNVKFPDLVSIELVIEDFKEMPWGTEFGVTRVTPDNLATTYYTPRRNSVFLPQPISLKRNQYGQFRYLLEGDADVDIGIVNIDNQRNPPVYKDRQSDLKAGEKTYPWNLKDNQGKLVVPGGYVARFRSKTRNTNIPVNDVCVVFHVLP